MTTRPAFPVQEVCAAARAVAEEELCARAGRPLGSGLVHGRLAEGLRHLHAQLTEQRAERRRGYLSQPPLQLAYLVHHLPMHAAKVAALVAEMQPSFPTDRPVRILDVGAGPLSAALGAAVALGGAVEVHALDHVGPMLRLGQRVLDRVRPGTSVTLHEGDVRDAPALARRLVPDLVVVANVVGELGLDGHAPARRALVLGLCRALASTSHLLVMEPGTRVHAQRLVEDRDEVLAQRAGFILAPCIGAPPCPMRGSRDWCHADRPVSWPAPYVAMARDAGLDAREVRFSWLWISPQPPRRQDPGILRIVGGNMDPGGGDLMRYACGATGRSTLVARGAAREALAAVPRGGLWEPRPGVSVKDEPPPRHGAPRAGTRGRRGRLDGARRRG